MSHNPDILQFISEDEIDKVIAVGTRTITNSGPSGTSYAGSDRIVETPITNPTGKKCLIRYRWKLDNGNFNSPDTKLLGAFTVDATAWGGPVSDPQPKMVAATAMGCSASSIIFRTLNGDHSNVTYTGTAMSPGPDSFSGTSHDFTFEYALVEIT